MIIEASQSKKKGGLNQVWIQLSPERQTKVIHLMAELALKRIMAQIEKSRKESENEQNSG